MAFVPTLARIAVCLLALTLAGCNATLATLEPIDGSSGRRGDVQAVPVAFTAPLEGAPEAVQARFVDQLAKEALSRKLRPVELAGARYFMRGYLSATTTETGTRFLYIWDVFDMNRMRIQRLEDEITVARRASDPWSLADDALLASLAAKSADDLADLIAQLPEALAAVPIPMPALPAPVQSALLDQ